MKFLPRWLFNLLFALAWTIVISAARRPHGARR